MLRMGEVERWHGGGGTGGGGGGGGAYPAGYTAHTHTMVREAMHTNRKPVESGNSLPVLIF
jgi:hypothetical protein